MHYASQIKDLYKGKAFPTSQNDIHVPGGFRTCAPRESPISNLKENYKGEKKTNADEKHNPHNLTYSSYASRFLHLLMD